MCIASTRSPKNDHWFQGFLPQTSQSQFPILPAMDVPGKSRKLGNWRTDSHIERTRQERSEETESTA